ncbi:MAG: hypothetical protein AAGA56_18655 [Myxococcota bacterium]
MERHVQLMRTAIFAGVVALGASATAANSVEKIADACMRAHAVLMASPSGEDASVRWDAIRALIERSNGRFVLVDEYEPGVAQKVSLQQYETRFVEGGVAYVAHCGAGITCNELAQEVLNRYPEAGSPRVYCGEVPHVLENPTEP